MNAFRSDGNVHVIDIYAVESQQHSVKVSEANANGSYNSALKANLTSPHLDNYRLHSTWILFMRMSDLLGKKQKQK